MFGAKPVRLECGTGIFAVCLRLELRVAIAGLVFRLLADCFRTRLERSALPIRVYHCVNEWSVSHRRRRFPETEERESRFCIFEAEVTLVPCVGGV